MPPVPLRARAAQAARAALLLGLLAGCEPAPPPPPEPAPPAPVASATPAPLSSERPDPRALPPDPARDVAGDPGALPALLDHPEGVPFPLPDPLPASCHPVAVTDPPAPTPGPAPLTFWIGGTGDTPARFTYPRALVASREDGTVVVVDKTGRLQRFDHDGRVLRLVHTPAIAQGKPTGLGLGADGSIYVADTHYARVLVYGPDLSLARVFGAPGRAAGRFMFVSGSKPGPDGLLWTTDYGDEVARLQAWTLQGEPRLASGAFGVEAGELRRPMSLAFGSGEVYVCDAVNHRIAVFGQDGAWRRALGGPGRGPGELDFPYDVVVDELGRLWISEFGNQRVQVLDPKDGKSLGLWGEPGRAPPGLTRPWGVALGQGERVWLLDSQGDRLYALERAAILAPTAARGD